MPNLILYDEDGGERELPYKWEICSHCDGHGSSSAYLGAFTRQDMDDAGEEFMENYFSGRLDKSCEYCGGSGKVKVVDRRQMSKEDLEAWDAQCEDEHCDREQNRMERLMEGGWREEGWYGE
jgi:RecJ-like exonuclease